MKQEFSPGTWRTPRSRHTLLIAMARDAEKLAAQGDRIKQLRAFARVSQETAATAIGVTLRGYQRWERGEGEINSENIKKLAKYFSTTPDYIEYGVVQRGAPAPDLSRNHDGAEQLTRIEAKLDQILDILAGEPDRVGLEIHRALDEMTSRLGREVGKRGISAREYRRAG